MMSNQLKRANSFPTTTQEELEMKKVIVVLAILAVIGYATAAYTQGRPEGPGRPGLGGPISCPAQAMMPPFAVEQLTDILSLTDDQAAKLKDVLTKCQDNLKPLRKKSADATKALRDALLASNFDAAKVKKLAITAEQAETAIIDAEIDEWVQIRAILTADQVKELQNAMTPPPHPAPGSARNQGGPGMSPPPGRF
jgi:Spy/CpxP family protein refolding chaperone